MSYPSLDEQKEVAYYSAAVTAWFTTSLEHDRSILTLSAAGIGLHLTLLTTVGLKSPEALALYIASIVCFVFSLLAVLRVFRLNQSHIEAIIAGKATGRDPVLTRIDLFALISFGLGVVLTSIVGVSAAIGSYSTERENVMAEKQSPKQSVLMLDSVNGAANLQPPGGLERSFNGVGSLRPAASQPTQGSTTQSQTTSQATPVPPPAQSQNSSGTK
jgi:hypothetical protein